MSLALMLFFQAAAPALPAPAVTNPDPHELIPIDFDLKRLTPSEACAGGGPSEIVVCGRRGRNGLNRVFPLTGEFDARPLIAEMGLGGDVTARMHADKVVFETGAVSNRIMVTFKLPF